MDGHLCLAEVLDLLWLNCRSAISEVCCTGTPCFSWLIRVCPVRRRIVSRARLAVKCCRRFLNRLRASHIWVLFFKLASLLVQHQLMGRISFLEALSIAERIECVVRGRAAWADAGKHYNFDSVTCEERITKNHSQFTLTERHMLPLAGLSFLCIDCTNTFFES